MKGKLPIIFSWTNTISLCSSRYRVRPIVEKTKVTKISTKMSKVPVEINLNSLEEVTSFTYLGSVVDKTGDSDTSYPE